MILELLFAERNHVCSVCVSNGHCELQTLAQELEIDHIRFPYIYPDLPVDASHHRFMLDQNRCILCTRCVRVCAEVGDYRSRAALGRRRKLHQLRQVRTALPHRRAERKGAFGGRDVQAPAVSALPGPDAGWKR